MLQNERAEESRTWLLPLIFAGALAVQIGSWYLPDGARVPAYAGILLCVYVATLVCLLSLRTIRYMIPTGLGFLFSMPVAAIFLMVALFRS